MVRRGSTVPPPDHFVFDGAASAAPTPRPKLKALPKSFPNMNTRTRIKSYTLALLLLLSGLSLAGARAQTGQSRPHVAGTPSEAVHRFYTAMRERRFREAFALSVFNPAVEGLSQQEFDELRPDFERMATGVPEVIELTGEQISGEEATVFMKLGEGRDMKVEPVYLVREKGAWIVGDREQREFIRKRGKKFFFDARITAHHDEVETMMRRITTAEAVYAAQNGGRFGDLAALVRAALVPQDILATDSTGYRFQIKLGADAKSYAATAEPAAYGRTGLLSFYADPHGLQQKDNGGKPLKPRK